MSGLKQTIRQVAVLIAFTAFTAMPVQGGTPAEFSVDWYTVDGGGGASTGGPFSLTGSVGQYDASPVSAQGGPFKLVGGFWGGAVHRFDLIFRDGFENP